MEPKLILVTGGAGFVGSRLCARLVQDGHRVISLDNYFTGTTDNHVSGVDYRTGHTRDVLQLVPETPDIVFHLGEYARVEKSFDDPTDLVWNLNVVGTFAVLEFCRRKNAKVIYAGSSTKFADGGDGRNQSPYAWTKASNSDLVRNYGAWFGLKYAITYFYNVYGEGEIANGPYSTVIGIFKQEYRRGNPMTVVSPGTQTRCFTHISDIVNGLLLVMEKGEGEYDIGFPRAYSILEVAKLFSSDIVMLPERKGNRTSSSVDPIRLRELGWEPRVSLEDHVATFKASVAAEPKTERRVLVFSTTFFPVEGPAEAALVRLMQQMPDVQFDVITSAFVKQLEKTSLHLPNVTIHRVGGGTALDKYRLIREGVKKAQELSAQHRYLFAWSIMASYAGIAAARFRQLVPDLPLLVTLSDQRFEDAPIWTRMAIKFVLRTADQISTSIPSQEQGLTRIDPDIRRVRSNRMGDPFANQIRFLYNAILRSTA